MKRFMQAVLFLVVVALISAPLLAEGPADGKAKPKEKPVPGVFRLPKQITPTAEQQAKLDALVAQYRPKLDELDKQADAVFTAEQKAARDAARKAAHAEGVKGRQAKERVDAAVQLGDDQKARLADLEKAEKKIEEEIKGQIAGLLTAEQKQTLEKPKKEHEKKEGPAHEKKEGPKPKGPKPKK